MIQVGNNLQNMASEQEVCDTSTLCNTKAEKSFVWGLRQMVARKMSSTIWGQKYIFQSQEKQIEEKFKRFEKMNNLQNMFAYIERHLSLYGRCVVTINKTKSGDVMLNVPNPFYFQGLGKVFVQPQLAVIYQRYEIDNRSYIVKTTYDCYKVVNEVYSMGERENLVRVFDKEAEILEFLRIERVWNHNLGFVPVVEMTNLPYYQYEFNNLAFIECADWYPAQIWEPLLYDTYTNLRKELWYCHSRILLEDASQELIKKMRDISGGRVKTDDLIIETGISGGSASFKPMPGTGDFTKYTQALDHLMDFYLKFCGGSRFSEGGGAQKTVAETSTVRSAMIESVNNKIILREQQIKELLKKVLCALDCIEDYWDDKEHFDFSINGNIMKDETTFIDNIIKQINSGLMSVEEAIQEIRNISSQEAKEKFEEIKDFNEENGIMGGMMLGDDLESGESNFNQATGEHKAPDKQGVE